MRIALILIAAGALFVTGCKTTETASTDGHHVFVKVDRHHIMSDEDGEAKHIKFVIKDGDGGLTVIEGDPSDPEIEFQIAQLKANGLLAGASGLDDKQVFIKKGNGSRTIVIPGDDEGGSKIRHVVIIKGEDANDAPLHLKGGRGKGGDGKGMHEHHEQVHKEVIILKGAEDKEEVRARLEELGIELDLDLEVVHEDETSDD